MSQHVEQSAVGLENVYKLPNVNVTSRLVDRPKHDARTTPVFEKLFEDATELDKLSKYPCSLNYGIYRDLELRYADKNISRDLE